MTNTSSNVDKKEGLADAATDKTESSKVDMQSLIIHQRVIDTEQSTVSSTPAPHD